MPYFKPVENTQKAYSTQATTNTSCFSAPTTPLFPMFGNDDLFDVTKYLDGSFNSTLNLLMMSATMNAASQNYLFDQNFNTKTNLAQLKKVYNSKVGERLANIAYKNANRTHTIGRCYHCVKDSLSIANLNHGEFKGRSAWQASDILKNHKNFSQVNVSRDQLKSLPAGCIIVWDPYLDRKGKVHKDGHIAVTLGNGKEASDHVQNLLTTGQNYKVYVPSGGFSRTS